MPLYDIECLKSGKIFERVISLEKFEEPILCACGAPARRRISAPLFSVDQTGYNCPVTGEWIGSKKQHQENLRKHNCRVLESGEKEYNQRQKAEQEAAFERKVEDSVERQIEGFSSDKKEKLYNEMVNSDVVVERR